MAKRRSRLVPVTKKVAKRVKKKGRWVTIYVNVTTYKTVYYWA